MAVKLKSSFLFRQFLITLICTLFIIFKAQSAEVHEFYNGIRSLGMGGAAIAVVNDETALIVNPAALGKLRDPFVTVVDPELELSANNDSIFSTSYLAALDPQAAMDKLKLTPARHGRFKMQLFPSLVLPNFGMGFLGKFRADGETNAAATTLDWQYENDYAFIFGFNFRMFDGRLKLGFNTKIINRIEYSNAAIPIVASGTTLTSLGAKEGLGIGADVGIILTGPWKTLPTLSVLVRDVGHTRFNFQSGLFLSAAERPTTLGQKVDVGLAMFPIMGKRKRASITLEVRDALNLSTETDPAKLYHAGFEMNFFDALFLRAGMNQRYWTAGFEMAVKNYQFQLASYGEEVGTAATNKEDRRYVLKFAYRF